MEARDDDDIIAATCLLYDIGGCHDVTEKRRHSTWVRSYLRRCQQESVYYSLFPDLKERHC